MQWIAGYAGFLLKEGYITSVLTLAAGAGIICLFDTNRVGKICLHWLRPREPGWKMKFRKDPVTDAVIEQEIAQVRRAGLSVYQYGFISRSGFQCQKRQDLILIDLKDLYA